MRLDPKDFAFFSRWSNDARRIAPRMNHGEPSLYKVMRAFFRPVRVIILRKFCTTLQQTGERAIDRFAIPYTFQVASPVEVQSNRSPRDTTLGKNEIFVDMAQNFVVIVIQIRKRYWKCSCSFKRIEVEDLK